MGGTASGGASPPANRAPAVNAGLDQSIATSDTLTLMGTASDDGLPSPPGALTITWTAVSGTGVIFGNAHAASTTATFSTAGTYVLRLSATDGALTATDDVQVAVVAAEPCTGLCASPVNIDLSASYSSGSLGVGAGCFQTKKPPAGGNCGNFVSPRALRVNGVVEPCDAGNWTLPPARNGGACIQVTAGDQSFAFFTLW